MDTLTVTWDEHDGRGKLTARDDSGAIVDQVSWTEPITARTNSHEIAEVITDRTVLAIDHDGDTVHVTVEGAETAQ